MEALVRAKVRQFTWVLLVLTYVVAFIGGVIGLSTFPASGGHYEVVENELVVTRFDPGGNLETLGASSGDVIELINGTSAVDAFVAGERIDNLDFRPADSAPGENLTHVAINLNATSLITDAIGLNIVGLAFAVMAMLIYLRAKPSTNTVLFSYMSISGAISVAIGPASVANQPWGRLAMGAAVYLASVLFLAFFANFTRSSVATAFSGDETTDRRFSFKAWTPEIWVLIAIASTVPWMLTAAGIGELFSVLRIGMLLLLVLALAGAIGMLAYRLRTAERENQVQLRIVTLGTAIGLVPFMWLTAIPMLVTGSEIVQGDISVIGFILIPISFGYAIAKHDLMGIRRLFHRGAAYAIISAAIIMVYGTILTGLNLLAPDSAATGPIQGALLVLMFAAAPTLTSVRRTALRIVDRILYDGAVTQEDLVSAISTVSANETDSERALDRAISFTGQGFDVEYAALVRFRDDGPTVEQTYNDPEPQIVNSLLAITQPATRGAKRSRLPGSDQAILIGALRDAGKESRAIVLGPKVSEDAFTDEEVDLLNTVTAVVSTALNRIRLIAEVQQQSEQLKNMGTEMQNIQESERQEISAYLHDEPLQKLAYVNSRVREMDIDEELKRLLDDVVRDLRGTSASLSPEMLRSHGLMSALKWMVQDQQKRGPFKVFLEIQGMQDADRLTDDVELTIYRSTQEALNNARKHANAKSVWVKLNKSKNQIDLAIEDNGVGIKATTSDMEERSPDQGLGLRGLKQRVTNLGGTLEIVPRPSRGTAFVVKLPLSEEDLKIAG